MGLVVAPLLKGVPKYVICITLAGLGPTTGRTKITYGTYLYKYISLSLYIYIYIYIYLSRSGRFGSLRTCQGLPKHASLKFRFAQGSVRVVSGRFALAKVCQSMLRSSFDSLKVRFGSLRFKVASFPPPPSFSCHCELVAEVMFEGCRQLVCSLSDGRRGPKS